LGIGDWVLGPIPNPQSPIPNPQSPLKLKKHNYKININKIKIIVKIYKIINTFIQRGDINVQNFSIKKKDSIYRIK